MNACRGNKPRRRTALGECLLLSRRGAVLIAVLAALVICAMLSAALLASCAAGREELRTQQWRVQAAWLAESGADRARARLAADRAYRGETWTLSADESGLADAAEVRIVAEPSADRPGRWKVQVEADYPNHPHRRAREARQWFVDLPSGTPVNSTSEPSP